MEGEENTVVSLRRKSLPMVGSEGIVVLFAFGPVAKPVADCCHSGVMKTLLL